ncbi:MAG: hypothetical protein JRF25_05980 [Deltaproteobacteria bacterium]|nr:hypothetical protein [Deltaproteobacteria bacterium]
MKEAIKITEQEIKWHEENRGEGDSSWREEAFIAGLRHLLDLFKQSKNENE